MKRFFLMTAVAIACAAGLRAAAWQPPRPKRVVLKNQAVVLMSERPQLPMVSMIVMIKSGSAADPTDQPGLANFTAEMLFHGTTLRDAQQFAAVFDGAGARYSSRCDRDASYFTLTCLAKDYKRLAPIFFAALLKPSFNADEAQRIRRELLTSIRSQQDRPHSAGMQAFNALLYGSHPYGHPVIGDSVSVAGIGRQDLIAFHDAWYRPNNCAIAIAGDFRESDIRSFLPKQLSGWAYRDVPVIAYPRLSDRQQPAVCLIHRPVSQSYVNLGFPGPSWADPDHAPAKVMNYILGGGGFTSRLTRAIRVRQGLAYDVDSYFDPRIGIGSYVFSVQTKCVSTDTAVKSLLAEMRIIMSDTVTVREREETRDYFHGYFPFRFETGELVNRQYLALELYRLGHDFYTTDLAKTLSVTGADIRDAARRLLDPERFVMTIVTDTSQTRLDLPGAVIVRE